MSSTSVDSSPGSAHLSERPLIVAACRYGDSRPKRRVKVPPNISWKEFLGLFYSRLGISPEFEIEVFDEKGIEIVSVEDLVENDVLVVKEKREKPVHLQPSPQPFKFGSRSPRPSSVHLGEQSESSRVARARSAEPGDQFLTPMGVPHLAHFIQSNSFGYYFLAEVENMKLLPARGKVKKTHCIVKVPHCEKTTASSEMFESEASLLRKISEHKCLISAPSVQVLNFADDSLQQLFSTVPQQKQPVLKELFLTGRCMEAYVYPLYGVTMATKIKAGLMADKTLKYAYQLADVMHFLQQRGVIHQNLLPENIQVMSNDRVMVCNFETAVQTDPTTCLLVVSRSVVAPSNKKGLAPEVITAFASVDTETVDYSTQYPWSFGVLSVLMAAGQHPLKDYPEGYESTSRVKYRSVSYQVLPDPNQYPAIFCKLVKRSLSCDPIRRPTLPQILSIIKKDSKIIAMMTGRKTTAGLSKVRSSEHDMGPADTGDAHLRSRHKASRLQHLSHSDIYDNRYSSFSQQHGDTASEHMVLHRSSRKRSKSDMHSGHQTFEERDDQSRSYTPLAHPPSESNVRVMPAERSHEQRRRSHESHTQQARESAGYSRDRTVDPFVPTENPLYSSKQIPRQTWPWFTFEQDSPFSQGRSHDYRPRSHDDARQTFQGDNVPLRRNNSQGAFSDDFTTPLLAESGPESEQKLWQQAPDVARAPAPPLPKAACTSGSDSSQAQEFQYQRLVPSPAVGSSEGIRSSYLLPDQDRVAAGVSSQEYEPHGDPQPSGTSHKLPSGTQEFTGSTQEGERGMPGSTSSTQDVTESMEESTSGPQDGTQEFPGTTGMQEYTDESVGHTAETKSTENDSDESTPRMPRAKISRSLSYRLANDNGVVQIESPLIMRRCFSDPARAELHRALSEAPVSSQTAKVFDNSMEVEQQPGDPAGASQGTVSQASGGATWFADESSHHSSGDSTPVISRAAARSTEGSEVQDTAAVTSTTPSSQHTGTPLNPLSNFANPSGNLASNKQFWTHLLADFASDSRKPEEIPGHYLFSDSPTASPSLNCGGHQMSTTADEVSHPGPTEQQLATAQPCESSPMLHRFPEALSTARSSAVRDGISQPGVSPQTAQHMRTSVPAPSTTVAAPVFQPGVSPLALNLNTASHTAGFPGRTPLSLNAQYSGAATAPAVIPARLPEHVIQGGYDQNPHGVSAATPMSPIPEASQEFTSSQTLTNTEKMSVSQTQSASPMDQAHQRSVSPFRHSAMLDRASTPRSPSTISNQGSVVHTSGSAVSLMMPLASEFREASPQLEPPSSDTSRSHSTYMSSASGRSVDSSVRATVSSPQPHAAASSQYARQPSLPQDRAAVFQSSFSDFQASRSTGERALQASHESGGSEILERSRVAPAHSSVSAPGCIRDGRRSHILSQQRGTNLSRRVSPSPVQSAVRHRQQVTSPTQRMGDRSQGSQISQDLEMESRIWNLAISGMDSYGKPRGRLNVNLSQGGVAHGPAATANRQVMTPTPTSVEASRNFRPITPAVEGNRSISAGPTFVTSPNRPAKHHNAGLVSASIPESDRQLLAASGIHDETWDAEHVPPPQVSVDSYDYLPPYSPPKHTAHSRSAARQISTSPLYPEAPPSYEEIFGRHGRRRHHGYSSSRHGGSTQYGVDMRRTTSSSSNRPLSRNATGQKRLSSLTNLFRRSRSRQSQEASNDSAHGNADPPITSRDEYTANWVASYDHTPRPMNVLEYGRDTRSAVSAGSTTGYSQAHSHISRTVSDTVAAAQPRQPAYPPIPYRHPPPFPSSENILQIPGQSSPLPPSTGRAVVASAGRGLHSSATNLHNGSWYSGSPTRVHHGYHDNRPGGVTRRTGSHDRPRPRSEVMFDNTPYFDPGRTRLPVSSPGSRRQHQSRASEEQQRQQQQQQPRDLATSSSISSSCFNILSPPEPQQQRNQQATRTRDAPRSGFSQSSGPVLQHVSLGDQPQGGRTAPGLAGNANSNNTNDPIPGDTPTHASNTNASSLATSPSEGVPTDSSGRSTARLRAVTRRAAQQVGSSSDEATAEHLTTRGRPRSRKRRTSQKENHSEEQSNSEQPTAAAAGCQVDAATADSSRSHVHTPSSHDQLSVPSTPLLASSPAQDSTPHDQQQTQTSESRVYPSGASQDLDGLNVVGGGQRSSEFAEDGSPPLVERQDGDGEVQTVEISIEPVGGASSPDPTLLGSKPCGHRCEAEGQELCCVCTVEQQAEAEVVRLLQNCHVCERRNQPEDGRNSQDGHGVRISNKADSSRPMHTRVAETVQEPPVQRRGGKNCVIM